MLRRAGPVVVACVLALLSGAVPADAGSPVVSYRTTCDWAFPGAGNTCTVTHTYPVPPLPKLTAIGVGDHPLRAGQDRAYNRMTFTFVGTFPGYEIKFVPELVAGGSGRPIPLEGRAVLQVRFDQAQAHGDQGGSTIVSQPPAHIGMNRILSYAQGSDWEGVLIYGLGLYTPEGADERINVRVAESKKTDGHGGFVYVVVVDVQSP